jgi:hypothetical protein
MDIFEEAVSILGMDVQFDKNNSFICSLNQEGEETSLILSIFRDFNNMSLILSVMTKNVLDGTQTENFWNYLNSYPTKPLIDEIGVGMIEGAENIKIYKTITLGGNPPSYIVESVNELIEIANIFDEKLIE